MRRKLGFYLGIIIVLGLLCSHGLATTEHRYINGKVTSISGQKLIIGERIFEVAQDCIVRVHYRKGVAIYERPGSFKEIVPGKWVNVKVLGGVISEVIIEEWK